MSTPIVLTGVGAGYGGRDVVTGIDARVPAGSWLAVIGPNGAGKSTLLKAIAGLVPHTGSVRIAAGSLSGGAANTAERELTALSARQRARIIGYAPQNPELPTGFTVTDYALLGRTPHLPPLGREGHRDLAIVTDVLARLDLSALADRQLRTLSGGERQRAVLARVLAQQPSVLLLDEPTTGLDIGHAQALLELVDRLRTEDGVSVISTLHDLSFAAQYPDTVLLLDGSSTRRGTVAALGKPAQVLTAELLATHYQARVNVVTDEHGQLIVAPMRRH